METALFNNGVISFAKRSNCLLRSFPRILEWNGRGYLVASTKKAPNLPTEFYAHDFLEINPRDVDSLLEFASHWGAPYHPCRDYGKLGWPEFSFETEHLFEAAPRELGIPLGYARDCEERRILSGLIETNAADGLPMKPDSEGWLEIPANGLACPGSSLCSPLWEAVRGSEWDNVGGRIISVAEASSVMEASQRAIRSLLAWIESLLLGKRDMRDFERENESIREAWSFATYAATACALPVDFYYRRGGNIISAVFDQLQETFLNAEPWKICAECGTPFKRKQNSPGAESKSGRYNPRARYCCEKCRNTNGNRRKSERIDHGI